MTDLEKALLYDASSPVSQAPYVLEVLSREAQRRMARIGKNDLQGDHVLAAILSLQQALRKAP